MVSNQSQFGELWKAVQWKELFQFLMKILRENQRGREWEKNAISGAREKDFEIFRLYMYPRTD